MSVVVPPRYVPILKVKPGEKAALELLADNIVSEIWPLLEIVELKDDPPDLESHVRKAFHHFRRAVRRCPLYFLDVHEIAGFGEEAARQVFGAAKNLGKPFVPVTGVSRTSDVEQALAAAGEGDLAIRLTRSEFEEGVIPQRLLSFIKRQRLEPRRVHLLIDLGAVHGMLPEGVDAMISQFLPLVPVTNEWRTLTVLACAFPQSMKVAQAKAQTFVERSDWKGWMRACFQRRAHLSRLPIYGDGGVQHPSGVEGFDPKVMPVSAAIRYAHGDGWVIVKGESTDTTPEAEQFPQLARELVASGRFVSEDHCYACRSIVRATRGPAAGHRRALDWRRIGTAHHITTVVQQLRTLPSP